MSVKFDSLTFVFIVHNSILRGSVPKPLATLTEPEEDSDESESEDSSSSSHSDDDDSDNQQQKKKKKNGAGVKRNASKAPKLVAASTLMSNSFADVSDDPRRASSPAGLNAITELVLKKKYADFWKRIGRKNSAGSNINMVQLRRLAEESADLSASASSIPRSSATVDDRKGLPVQIKD